jgi:hypothetical protein
MTTGAQVYSHIVERPLAARPVNKVERIGLNVERVRGGGQHQRACFKSVYYRFHVMEVLGA